MSFDCFTLKDNIQDVLLKEKGSKFLGYAFSVENEAEVQSELKKIKERYPDATHHCYAYRLGFEGEIHRANDDGEPNGTAGLPIYNQLISKELTYCLVVVVRYYGGTKLGVSGLIKAYKGCAEATLALGERKKRTKTKDFVLRFPYGSQSQAMRGMERFQSQILHQNFGEGCQFTIRIDLEKVPAFLGFFDAFHSIKVSECE